MMFGLEENIDGLSWSNEENVCSKWLNISCICFNNGECMVGYAEKQIVIERSIDQTKEICFSRLNFQLKCFCNRKKGSVKS